MSRIERAYVVDLAVRDIHAAAERFSKILGMEGVRMSPEQDPEGHHDGIHFPVGGINALGLMTYRGEPDPQSDAPISKLLATRGEGIWLLGHLVDDVDEHAQQLIARGYSVPQPEPAPYADGRLIFTDEIHGTLFEFARHHSDAVSELWRKRHRASLNRRVERSYRVDIAVEDLGKATETFADFLGLDPTPSEVEALDPSGVVKGVSFPIGGLDELNLVTVEDKPIGALATRIERRIQAGLEGPLLLGFVVSDIEKVQSELQELDVQFEHSEPKRSPRGRSNLTQPVCGVILEFVELET